MTDQRGIDDTDRSRFLGWARGSPDAAMGSEVELSSEQYQEYVMHIDRLSHYQSRRELFFLVESNYHEWRSGLDRAWEILRSDPGFYQRSDNLPQLQVEANRRLLNFLSSIRTYIDHTAHALSNSEITNATEQFDEATNQLYDGHFAYRFLSRLRNYAQHQGVPISSIEMSCTADKDGKPHYFQLIGFNRDTLLEYRKWNTVREELANMPQTFNARELVDEMMQCIRDLALTVDRLYLPSLLESTSFLRLFVQPVLGRPGNPCILSGFREHIEASLADEINPDIDFSSSVNLQWVPLDWITAVEKRARDLAVISSEDAGATIVKPARSDFQIPRDLPKLRIENGHIVDEQGRILARLIDPNSGNPITWPPVSDEMQRAANMMATGPMLVWALMSVINGIGQDSLQAEDMAGAMFAVALAIAPGKVRFTLDKMDPEFLERLREESRKRGLM